MSRSRRLLPPRDGMSLVSDLGEVVQRPGLEVRIEAACAQGLGVARLVGARVRVRVRVGVRARVRG